ncbi:MAG: hypothetical protein EH225_04210 [Calditrichaeota bacterium]|nr:MAG: hypothetical protein EH225_04210 [Calditrichota bacterium]
MKKILLSLFMIAAALLLFNGCDLFGPPAVSPDKRISDFTANLNTSSRLSTYTYISSSASLYDQIKVSTWWDSTAFSSFYSSFSFNLSYASSSSGIQTYTGSMSSSAATYNSVVVTFKEDLTGSDVWYINSISLEGTPVIY